MPLQRSRPTAIQLHPHNHYVPPSKLASTQRVFDVIVIGSGPAGRRVATLTAAPNAGLTTLVIESELFGGNCPFGKQDFALETHVSGCLELWACVPSKALLRPAEALGASRAVGGARELISEGTANGKGKGAKVDVEGVFARRDKITQGWDDAFFGKLMEGDGNVVVRGEGRLAGEKKVKVTNADGDETVFEAKHAVVLATGASIVLPKIPGLEEINYWTSREATSANYVPEHLVIVGGGVVGCEMATFYGSLGRKVTLIAGRGQLLPKAEPEAADMVKKALEADGVDVRLNTHLKKLTKSDEHCFTAELSSGDKLTGSILLIATGQKANIDDVGLKEVGVDPSGKLQVSESLCVKTSGGGEWLYAVGDTNGHMPTTHMGVYQGRAVANAIIARAKGKEVTTDPYGAFSATSDRDLVTQIIFTDPNVAMVGLTAAQAKDKGIRVKTASTQFMFPGAFVHAEMNYDGWAQWVIDEDSQQIVGATFVGREAGDLLHASTVAMLGKIPVPKLWHAVAAFPSMSEIYTALLNASGY